MKGNASICKNNSKSTENRLKSLMDNTMEDIEKRIKGQMANQYVSTLKEMKDLNKVVSDSKDDTIWQRI